MCLYTKNEPYRTRSSFLACGERGIRTPGASQLNGFQDRRNRPLCHLSSSECACRMNDACQRPWGDRDSSSILEATSFSDDVFLKSGAKVLLFFQLCKFLCTFFAYIDFL